MKQAADASRPAFTARQGQVLAFIYAYTLVNGRPPAEQGNRVKRCAGAFRPAPLTRRLCLLDLRRPEALEPTRWVL